MPSRSMIRTQNGVASWLYDRMYSQLSAQEQKKEKHKMDNASPLLLNNQPIWFNGKTISEPIFCFEFLDGIFYMSY